MGVRIQVVGVYKQARLYCSTSEVQFGPRCVDMDHAKRLICYCEKTLSKDPRELSHTELVEAAALVLRERLLTN
jgi:hypothetical protein